MKPTLRRLVNRLRVTSVLSHWERVVLATRKYECGYAWLAYLCWLNFSYIWIKITLWEPEFNTISAWALQSHRAQCGCMLEAMCSRLYLWGLASALLTPRMKASGNPTSHCSGAASGTHTAWSAPRVVRRTQRGLSLLRSCLRHSSMSFLRRKSCYKAFYLSFIRVYFCGIVVNTACQIAKPSSRKKGQLLKENVTRK